MVCSWMQKCLYQHNNKNTEWDIQNMYSRLMRYKYMKQTFTNKKYIGGIRFWKIQV